MNQPQHIPMHLNPELYIEQQTTLPTLISTTPVDQCVRVAPIAIGTVEQRFGHIPFGRSR